MHAFLSSRRLWRASALVLFASFALAVRGQATADAAGPDIEHDHTFSDATFLVVPAANGEAPLRVEGRLTLGGRLDLLFAATPRPGVYRIYQSRQPALGRLTAVSVADSYASARLSRDADGRWEGRLDGLALSFAEPSGELRVRPVPLSEAP